MRYELLGIVDGYGPTGELLTTALRRRGVECVHVESSATALPEFRATFQPECYRANVSHAGSVPQTAGSRNKSTMAAEA
jgi:hypothetical protein